MGARAVSRAIGSTAVLLIACTGDPGVRGPALHPVADGAGDTSQPVDSGAIQPGQADGSVPSDAVDSAGPVEPADTGQSPKDSNAAELPGTRGSGPQIKEFPGRSCKRAEVTRWWRMSENLLSGVLTPIWTICSTRTRTARISLCSRERWSQHSAKRHLGSAS